MPKETFKYPNEDITVLWKPKRCIHSTRCWKGLIEVFDPKEKPWIKMDSATTEKIIEQVKQCPSGALSYHINNEIPNAIASESVDLLKIEATLNGPYLIKTRCLIAHSNGREETKNGTVALCRCGASLNKPYCDGSHKKIGFKG